VKTSGGKVIRDDESEAETQAHWLPVFDYDGESTADQTDGEYDNDGFDPYDDDESAVNDRGQVEAANNEPDMRAGLSDSAPMVDIHAGGSLPRRQSDGVVVDSQNAEDEEEEEPATDVRFVPEFEFQSDEDDDDAVQATFGSVNRRGESIYGISAFSSLFQPTKRQNKGGMDVELASFGDTPPLLADTNETAVSATSGRPLSGMDGSIASSGVTEYIDEILRLDKLGRLGLENATPSIDDQSMLLTEAAESASRRITGRPGERVNIIDIFQEVEKEFMVQPEKPEARSDLKSYGAVAPTSPILEDLEPGVSQRDSRREEAELDKITPPKKHGEIAGNDVSMLPGIVLPTRPQMKSAVNRNSEVPRTLEGLGLDAFGRKMTDDVSEQSAQWLVNPAEVVVREHYVPSRFKEKTDIPARELKLRPRFLFQLDANVQFRILAGFDWPSQDLLLAKVIKAEDDIDLAESEFPGYGGGEGKGSSENVKKGPVSNDAGPSSRDKLNSKQRQLLSSLVTGGAEDHSASLFEPKVTFRITISDILCNICHLQKRPSFEGTKGKQAQPSIPKRNVDVKRFSRDNEDCIGAHAKGLSVKMRAYDPILKSLHCQVQAGGHDGEEEQGFADSGGDHARVGLHTNVDQQEGPAAQKLPIPDMRMSIGLSDLVVWLAAKGRRKRKILGKLKEGNNFMEELSCIGKPFITASITGYDVTASANCESSVLFNRRNVVEMEYRVAVSVRPIRLFLNEGVLEFAKTLGECQECIDIVADRAYYKAKKAEIDDESAGLPVDVTDAHISPRVSFYIQCISVSSVDVVIDYEPSILNIDKLQDGDYLQFLNFFPLENMNLTLKSVKFTAISSFGKFFASAGELWVRDIYEHQMFRVLSGAAPLKALTNIGAGLQDLIVTPLAEYQKARSKQQQFARSTQAGGASSSSSSAGGSRAGNQHVTRALKKSTMKLLQTVSRETLDASHKLTMLLARGIETLATGTEVPQPQKAAGRVQLGNNPKAAHLIGAADASAGYGGPGTVANRPGQLPVAGQPQSMSSLNRPLRHRTDEDGRGSVASQRKIGDEWEPQPVGVGEGLQRGIDSLSREIASAVDMVVTVPLRSYRRTGNKGQYVREVVKALPIAILRPIAGTAEAMSYTLLGLRNNIDPAARRRDEDLWDHSLDISDAHVDIQGRESKTKVKTHVRESK
jgi:hypothetical protein